MNHLPPSSIPSDPRAKPAAPRQRSLSIAHYPLSIILASLILICAFRLTAQDLPLPVIPAATFDITQFGAVGDGSTLNTAAIQKAIAACSAAGGGTVRVPPGKFLTGPFTLASSLNLHLDAGATLLLDDDRAQYPVRNNRYQDAITVSQGHDIEITGQGAIDGQGQKWWDAFRADANMTHRPYLIQMSGCSNVALLDVTLQNSPMFHLVPKDCTGVTIRGITIKAPANAPNTDGIDPSGWNFLITQCTLDTGDDNIAIKPGGSRAPGNKNFTITHCTFLRGHGMSVGSGSRGGLDGLTVSDCSFTGTDSGIRIKSGRGAGGLLQNCVYERLAMTNVNHPIYIVDYYPERNAPKDPAASTREAVSRFTPLVRNITIRDLFAVNCPAAGTIYGLPEAPVSNVTLDHVNISAGAGLKIYFARDVRFSSSKINVEKGDRLILYDALPTGLE
jgi:polygalacturonase